MGEYARQYTLDRFGVDIGDDREPVKTKPVKRYGCSCGRVFITQQAKEQHQKDTGHINKGGVHCRIGSSEIDNPLARSTVAVHCRIGSSEKWAPDLGHDS